MFRDKLVPISATLLFLNLSVVANADVVLASPFTDNMVLQRNMSDPVWGTADSGELVTVSVAGKSVSAIGGTDKRWMVKLPPMPAATDLTLTVMGKNTITIKNVDVGEVWLASGQSNMTYPLLMGKTYNAPDIAASLDPDLRMFVANGHGAMDPEPSVSGNWQSATPGNVLGFSAVGYYFAKNLRKALGVPVGIIHSSSGGTDAEAWASAESLEADPQFKQIADDGRAKVISLPDDKKKFTTDLDAWETANGAHDAGNSGFADGWAKPDFDDSSWQTTSIPSTFGGLGMKGGGVVWYRKSIVFTTAQDTDMGLNWQENVLNVYVNGTEVQQVWPTEPFYPIARRVHIPKELIKAGQPNEIAIRIYALTQGGYFYMHTRDLGLPADPSVLDDTWHYKIEQRFPDLSQAANDARPMPPMASVSKMPGGLFNGYINPLIPYAIKGCIWYQGENNVSRHAKYPALMADLISGWRAKWSEGNFPFEIEQIANYGDPKKDPAPSDQAMLREAQVQVAKTVSNCALAVAIDIGAVDIHPPNKREVGRRLSLLALSNAYGQKIVHAGPTYSSMNVEGSQIRIKFDHADGGLMAQGGTLQQFAVAGSDMKFVWSDAKIDGKTVRVSSPSVPNPVAVRYAWADNPDGCNLYNGAGLPAVPFRTDDWEK